MNDRTVQYQGYRHGYVQQSKPVQDKDPRLAGYRDNPVECQEKYRQPEYRVGRLDRKFSCCEEEWEQGDMCSHGKRPESS